MYRTVLGQQALLADKKICITKQNMLHSGMVYRHFSYGLTASCWKNLHLFRKIL